MSSSCFVCSSSQLRDAIATALVNHSGPQMGKTLISLDLPARIQPLHNPIYRSTIITTYFNIPSSAAGRPTTFTGCHVLEGVLDGFGGSLCWLSKARSLLVRTRLALLRLGGAARFEAGEWERSTSEPCVALNMYILKGSRGAPRSSKNQVRWSRDLAGQAQAFRIAAPFPL